MGKVLKGEREKGSCETVRRECVYASPKLEKEGPEGSICGAALQDSRSSIVSVLRMPRGQSMKEGKWGWEMA